MTGTQPADTVFPMDEDNTESSSSQGNKRKTRGPTLCSKLKEKFKNQKTECNLDFDEDGNPVGDMASQFASYVGTAARLHVNINIKSWDVVDEGLKDMIWEDIKMHWKLKADQIKKQVLEAVGKSWKDFKANLVRHFMRSGRNACETYPFINEDDWETFKTIHESAEFKEVSEKAKESQKHNKDPHFVGKGGYRGNRGKWRQDDPIASLDKTQSSIDPSILSTERSYDWVRARTKKNEDGSFYIPNDHTKEVFQKIGELQGQISDGLWTPCGHDDVLTRALGNKEHGGRVRGVGGRAKIKSVFGSQRSRQSGVVSNFLFLYITGHIKLLLNMVVRRIIKITWSGTMKFSALNKKEVLSVVIL
ncbi:uncharacterized protein LOC141710885 [Apium graveolens]|uniref:uncharacterized protein LOC141710885 n=1 Tax=Apium graveolens TaxID=4045 RepID=UPI003D7ACF23